MNSAGAADTAFAYRRAPARGRNRADRAAAAPPRLDAAVSSMGEGVKEGVDPERISLRPERHEIARVVAFALPRIADIRVVRDQDDDAAAAIGNRADMRLGAVGALLRRPAARAHVEADVRNLRDVAHFELCAENRMLWWDVEDRILVGRKGVSDLTHPVFPLVRAPEVV